MKKLALILLCATLVAPNIALANDEEESLSANELILGPKLGAKISLESQLANDGEKTDNVEQVTPEPASDVPEFPILPSIPRPQPKFSNPWVYLEDKLITMPKIIMAGLFLLKVAGGVGALSIVGGIDLGRVQMDEGMVGKKVNGKMLWKKVKDFDSRICDPSSIQLREWPRGVNEWICSWFNWAGGYQRFGGVVSKIIFLAVGFAGYKLTSYLLESIVYGSVLSDFMKDYPVKHQKQIPSSLRGFFDAEYEEYIHQNNGGFKYVFKRTGKVIKHVKSEIGHHNRS